MSTDLSNEVTQPLGQVAEAIEAGVVGDRLWFYANYHCNLECSYCLTESGPNVPRRMLSADDMLVRAREAKALGFRALGVTGGEPFMVPSMPETIAALSELLPVVVLSNATLFHGPRLERVVAALAGKNVHIQISLDAPDADTNDSKRGSSSNVSTSDKRDNEIQQDRKCDELCFSQLSFKNLCTLYLLFYTEIMFRK